MYGMPNWYNFSFPNFTGNLNVEFLFFCFAEFEVKCTRDCCSITDNETTFNVSGSDCSFTYEPAENSFKKKGKK